MAERSKRVGCIVPDCETVRHHAKGYCYKHYLQQWAEARRPARVALREFKAQMRSLRSFWNHVDAHDDAAACWEWRGYRSVLGYGRLKSRHGRSHSAHRFAYEATLGNVPDGLELDHLCRNSGCVNPWHLEPVTHRENVLRGSSPIAANVLKTHCPRGHPYDRWHPKAGRACRQCKTAQDREPQRKRRAAAATQRAVA